jgi:hypothetical protein
MNVKSLILIVLAFAVGYAFGLYRTRQRQSSFQNSGESLVSRLIKDNFAPPDFHLLNHITLRLEDGTTQIDHILVSRFGVFVIETKNHKGWIFAHENQSTWTQVFPHGKFKFQNPLHQNMRHTRAVQSLLDFLPPEAIKPVVVFSGDAEFKTEMPAGVFTISGLVDHLRGFKEELMSMNRLHFCVGRLETARLSVSGQTDLEHIESLKSRFHQPI